ncbi:PH domain-containing protein [Paratractidigestivibacter sp.]|uniref:PH domain-containing protein n=1 Tax=Paratractidigestivibacter sp. TaxID=2847316 RepID=UPI002AC941DF|nr:PH domain-containing protein [Paratractidigestivibacter sp.]
MALKDMMKDMASAAVSQAQGAVQDAMERDSQAVKSGGAMSGVLGHYTEMSAEAAQKDYGMYLMRGETFTRCFALVRDKMLFTDRRIIFIDHQGMTGAKAAVVSIDLQSIVEVGLETGGMGFDHAELSFAYITSPYYKVYGVQTATKTLEFPKGFDVQGLYSLLSELAYENVRRLNA